MATPSQLQPPSPPQPASLSSPAAVAVAVGGYMFTSSLMLIVNKLAVHSLPAPSTVLLAQLVASSASMRALGALGLVEVERLSLATVQRFYVVPIAFLGTVFANIKILQYANVETFIVFRASTPLLISVLDYVYLGRELPSGRSWACLALLLVGAIGYVLNDKFFRVDAYYWVVVWFAVFCFDQVYIKHAITNVKMTTWTQVYYTNTLASLPLAVVLVASGELATLSTFDWTGASVFWLTASAVMGVAIAYFSFLARASVSATYFTVIGNTCKVVTVLINVVMWDLHATPGGLFSLGVCLMGAAFYKQAPLRREKKAEERAPGGGEP